MPLVSAERRRKRNALLDRTETDVEALPASNFALDKFNRCLGRMCRRKMGKHFKWKFDKQMKAFTSTRKRRLVDAGERLVGIYVIGTNLSDRTLGDREVVLACKNPASVERSFHSLNTLMPKVCLIYH